MYDVMQWEEDILGQLYHVVMERELSPAFVHVLVDDAYIDHIILEARLTSIHAIIMSRV